MVAYSFHAGFRFPILAGTKRQTIRADRKRHARPGETLQLYTGMRTRHCALVATAICREVVPVRLGIEGGWVEIGGCLLDAAELDDFARRDGFADWRVLVCFWNERHPGTPVFGGWLIGWTYPLLSEG